MAKLTARVEEVLKKQITDVSRVKGVLKKVSEDEAGCDMILFFENGTFAFVYRNKISTEAASCDSLLRAGLLTKKEHKEQERLNSEEWKKEEEKYERKKLRTLQAKYPQGSDGT